MSNPSDGSDHDPVVFALIRDEIARRGPITFARFMELALYAPGAGYYMRDAERIGPRGDYYTSSNLHPLFGDLIAKQLVEMAEILGATPVTIIEQGAGRGSLAFDVVQALTRVDAAAPWKYVIVEKSPAMIAHQQRLLEPMIASGRVMWADALPSEPLDGCVLSNELVDAFPVHRVIQKNGGLKEIFVDVDGEGLAERLDSPSTPDLAVYLDRVGVTLVEGQQAEINLLAIDWMRAVGRSLRRGFVLTIDYGYPADELYDPSRRRGTLLSYYQHRASEAFYERIGRQDLTAHVDFTTLAWAGGDAGLEVEGFVDQTSFLLGLGAHDAAERLLTVASDEADRERMLAGIRGLLDPQDMGRLFKVLIQRKGVSPGRLRGLSLGSGGGRRLDIATAR
jgi:SAM-dependent MidA family methyltransferase